MNYDEVSVIIDGALDEERTFTLPDQLPDEEAFLAELKREADSAGFTADIYLTYHPHAPADCECSQFATDHSPAYTYGPQAS